MSESIKLYNKPTVLLSKEVAIVAVNAVAQAVMENKPIANLSLAIDLLTTIGGDDAMDALYHIFLSNNFGNNDSCNALESSILQEAALNGLVKWSQNKRAIEALLDIAKNGFSPYAKAAKKALGDDYKEEK